MTATGWTGDGPEDAAPAQAEMAAGGFAGAILAHRPAPGEGLSAIDRARMARDKPEEPFDEDERVANLLARGYSAGQLSQLTARLGEAQSELAAEQQKLEADRKFQERIQRDHMNGKITAFDIARMSGDRDEGDPGKVARLERRVQTLQTQLREASEMFAPVQERQPDPVGSAVSRAQRAGHQAFVEATRARMTGQPQAPRPFDSGGGEAAEPDCETCRRALRDGKQRPATASQMAEIHRMVCEGGPDITRNSPYRAEGAYDASDAVREIARGTESAIVGVW